MSTRTVRDMYGNTFEIDATALRYWQDREGYTILDDPETGDEPKPAESPKTSSKAVRPAQDKE
ncbi:hypothetical protein ACFYUV_20545 [Nonomuraea sp. NPDC003560]|uniref:hypothetical protein n=1 Tax=Nonomuraea sp. NPDC003560 TaxID=3364341 RepID=UPI00367B4668